MLAATDVLGRCTEGKVKVLGAAEGCRCCWCCCCCCCCYIPSDPK